MDTLILLPFLAVPAIGFLVLTAGLTRMSAVRDLPWLGRTLWLMPAAIYAARMLGLLAGQGTGAVGGEPWLYDLTLALRDWVAIAGATWFVLFAAAIASRITAEG